MEPNDKNKTGKEVLELLKELAEVQSTKALLSAKIFVEKGKQKVDEKVGNLKQSILDQAKLYGQKADKVIKEYELNSVERNTILGEYKSVLDEINKKYEEPLKIAIAEKNEFEEWEADDMSEQSFFQDRKNDIKESEGYKEYSKKREILVKEIKSDLDKGNFEEAKLKTDALKEFDVNPNENPAVYYEAKIKPIKEERKELKEVIELCNSEIEKITAERDAEIEKVVAERDSKLLALNDKQTPFRRLAFGILNRINGAKRFKDNVIDKVNDNIAIIRDEVLPKVEKKVAEKSEQFANKIIEKKNEMLEEMKETGETVKEFSEKVKGSITKTGKQIGENFNKAKDGASKKINEGIEYAKEGVSYIKDSVESNVKKAGESVKDTANNIRTSVKENVIDKGKQSFNDIVMRGRNAKINVLQKLNDSIQNSIDKSIEKNNQMKAKGLVTNEGR